MSEPPRPTIIVIPPRRLHRSLALRLFAVALAIRVAYVLALYFHMGEPGLMIEDSAYYLAAAAALLGMGPPLEAAGESLLAAQTLFMPGYIWFLAAHMLAFGSKAAIFPALGQSVIDSLSCVIIARLAEQVRPGIGSVAGWFAVFNPTQIVLSGLILVETLFLPACALALLSALAWLDAPRWRVALLLGAALGAGIFMRVMLLPLAIGLPIMLALFQMWRRRLDPKTTAQLATAILLALTAQTPVLVQNYSRYDSFALTSQNGIVVLYWVVPWVRKAADGTDYDKARAELEARFAVEATHVDTSNPFATSRAMTRLAVDELGRLGSVAMIKAYVFGAALNIFSPAAILSPPIRLLPRTGFYATQGETLAEKALNFLFRNDNSLYALILLTSGLGTLTLRAIQFLGIARSARDPRIRSSLLILLAWIAYILAIYGPVASAKYRHPAEPAFAVLFALAVSKRKKF
jgi:4-amino-4-deoxy-L-arabinose transferase-like glycosyltransferase